MLSLCQQSRGKGGVCILAKASLQYDVIDMAGFGIEDFCQLAAAKLKLEGGKQLLVMDVYRVPSYNCDNFFNCIGCFLDEYIRKSVYTIVILILSYWNGCFSYHEV